MKKIIYKIWQALRSWIQKQERLYEEDYIRGICRRFHRVYPECKFKCYYDTFDKNTFILHLDEKYAALNSVLRFLDEEKNQFALTFPYLYFIYDHFDVVEEYYYNPKSNIIIYEIK